MDEKIEQSVRDFDHDNDSRVTGEDALYDFQNYVDGNSKFYMSFSQFLSAYLTLFLTKFLRQCFWHTDAISYRHNQVKHYRARLVFGWVTEFI